MELLGEVNGVCVYDDFAHHPTAIETTLAGLRAKVGDARITAILEPRSNTMKMGVHQQTLMSSLATADEVMLFEPPNLSWSLQDAAKQAGYDCYHNTDDIVAAVAAKAKPGEHVLIMSNGGFNGIHTAVLSALREKRS
jgi:UDP-N-acetylmuramate: L-alanyl-gamma-D-glutamyl-meso-diaminopimelate ligase